MARQPLVETHELKHEITIDDRFWLVRWYRFLYGSGSTLTFCRLFWGTLLSIIPAIVLGMTMPLWWPPLQAKRRWQARVQAREARLYQERNAPRLAEERRQQERLERLDAEREEIAQRLREAQLAKQEGLLEWQILRRKVSQQGLSQEKRQAAREQAHQLEVEWYQEEERERERLSRCLRERSDQRKREEQALLEEKASLLREERLAHQREIAWREIPLRARLAHAGKKEALLAELPVEDPGPGARPPLPGVFHLQRKALQRGGERAVDGLGFLWACFSMRLEPLAFLLRLLRWMKTRTSDWGGRARSGSSETRNGPMSCSSGLRNGANRGSRTRGRGANRRVSGAGSSLCIPTRAM